MFLKFTYYAQYYAPEQELLSDYFDIHNYIIFMSNSLDVADNVIMSVLMNSIMLYLTMTVLLEYIDCLTTIFHKYLTLLLIVILYTYIILTVFLMLLMTHYTRNYAGIVGGSLVAGKGCILTKNR